MNVATIIIALIIVALLALAVYYLMRNGACAACELQDACRVAYKEKGIPFPTTLRRRARRRTDPCRRYSPSKPGTVPVHFVQHSATTASKPGTIPVHFVRPNADVVK